MYALYNIVFLLAIDLSIVCCSYLSSGGFSFGCTNEQELPEKLTVDLFNGKGLNIWDLPVLTVWVKKKGDPLKSSISSAKIGVRFQENLSLDHQYGLSALFDILKENKL